MTGIPYLMQRTGKGRSGCGGSLLALPDLKEIQLGAVPRPAWDLLGSFPLTGTVRLDFADFLTKDRQSQGRAIIFCT
jgi:hypothetical protein